MLEIRLIACATMLILASIIDLKKRELPDKIWIGFGSFGLLLTVLEFNANSINIGQYTIGIGITAPIAYVIYKTGLFGGADAKAMMAIAVLLPFYDMPFKFHNLPAFTILTNATVLTFAHVIHNVARNSLEFVRNRTMFEGFQESGSRKALAFVMGFRSNSPKGYLFAMETTSGNGRKFNFHPGDYDDYVASTTKNIWVTPALPFIVYMAFGFAAMIFFGDLLALVFASMF